MENKRFARTLLLFKESGFEKLQKAKVLLLGVGGVGGFALDCLYRVGIGEICIVDYDVFDASNQNRQIGAFEGVGYKKVEILAQKYPGIKAMDCKVTQDFINTFDFESFDVVIDAIDDIDAKIALALKIANTKDSAMPHLLSSTGSAKKLDPSKIQFASIWKSYGDKFARKFREGLKKQGFKGNFMVAFSPEEPKCKELGSFSGVTASFGLRLASEAVQIILKQE